MKKWNFKVWWMLTFRNPVLKRCDFDAYKVTFRKFTMDIKTKSGNLKLRTMLMQHPQSFLLHCVSNGDEKVVEWFCNELYQFVSFLTTDNGLIQDINKSFEKFYKRMDKKSERLAKSVSKEDDKLNEEIVNANLKVSKMSKKERKAHKESVRKVLTQENK